MVDKSKSHDEELEQTFGSYETEMPEEEPANKGGEKKKSGNLAKYLIIGVGAVAVLFVVWTMVLPLLTGGANRQAPRPQPNVGQVQNQNNGANNGPTVNVEPVPEVSVNNAATVNVPTVTVEAAPKNQQAGQVNDFLNNQNNQAANGAGPNVTITPGDNNSNITVTMPEEAQVTVAPIVQQPAPVQQAASVTQPQVNNGDLMNDIRSYFDSKFENIQQADKMRGEQLQKVEVSVDNLVQRVTALEKGGVKTVTVRPTNVVTNTVRKAPVAKNVVRKDVVEKQVVEVKRAPVEASERVIASKASTAAGGDELLIVKKPKAEVNKYKVHSLFNGRVWIENADNTHSSFSINDRLPGGELIKSIDMEKDLIITDKGTIKGK